MPIVTLDSVDWDVAADYVAPVAIGEAVRRAREGGYELPTPALVDAIWKAATCRVEPLPRHSDGTNATMANSVVYADQKRRIAAQTAGKDCALLAGSYKDVVRDPHTGRIGLYGWHRLDGKVWQPLFTGHGLYWIDYSQGWRACRRVDPTVG